MVLGVRGFVKPQIQVVAVDQWTGSKPSAGTQKEFHQPTDMCFEDFEKVLDLWDSYYWDSPIV